MQCCRRLLVWKILVSPLMKVGRGRRTVSEDPPLLAPTLTSTPTQALSPEGPVGNACAKLLTLLSMMALTNECEAEQLPQSFICLVSAWTTSPTLQSIDLAPHDSLHSINPRGFWPHVSEQEVHQLSTDADNFYLRQFSRIHILEHSFKEDTGVNKQSVRLICFLEDMGF